MTLEQLLNKLIDKGWKPRGENVELYGTSKNTFGERIVIFIGNAGGFKKWGCTYRQIVSKESGLWQFVCENGMYDYKMGEHKNIVEDFFWNERENCNYYGYLWDKSCWEYYVVESALCNEENLEKFLLDNIKIS